MNNKLALVLYSLIVIVNAKKLPSFIKKCKYDDNLNKCIIKTFEENREKFMAGVPEMQIPPIDPLVVDSVVYETGNGISIGLNANFTEVKVEGSKNVHLKNMSVDLKDPYAIVEMEFPTLRIRSNYHVRGKILIIQLDGNGLGEANFTNINAKQYYKGKIITKHEKQYIKWTTDNIDFKIGGASFYFHDLFKNNPELTENTNKILNENIMDIIEEFKPLVLGTITSVTSSILDRVFTRFSIDELFINET